MIRCDNCVLCEEHEDTCCVLINWNDKTTMGHNTELVGTSGVHAKSYQRFVAMEVKEKKKKNRKT